MNIFTINNIYFSPFLIMNKILKTFKLPATLINNKTANTINGYMSMLGPHSSYVSYLIHKRQQKYYFVYKDPQFPLVPFDWTMYTLMRCHARSIIVSGITVRHEPFNFSDQMGTFGRQELMSLYENNVHQPLSCYVYSRMKDEEIKKWIGTKFIKYVPLRQIVPENTSMKQISCKLNQMGIGPIIHEYGQQTFQNAMGEVKQNEQNFMQMIILSIMQGNLPEKYVGKQCNTTVLNRDFDKVWQSEAIDDTQYFVNGQKRPISLKFGIFIRKDKPKTLNK